MKITKKNSNEIIFYDNSNTMKDCVINAIKSGADLRGANLRDANLRGADLRCAYLGGANLRGANLRGANLCCAYLRCADLGGADLRGVDLRCAYLRDVDLGGADLGGANLGDADLGCAYLRCANLGDADLRDANLRGADLGDAYLGGADLRCADFRCANICGADLGGVDLRDTNICCAYLRDTKNIPFIPLSCPSDGEFIGWKKVSNKLIKLFIPSDARRSSATSNKCRCDKAKVLEITDLDGNNPIASIINYNYAETLYVVGEMVYSDLFDEYRWDECSHGIHFFINKQEAINY